MRECVYGMCSVHDHGTGFTFTHCLHCLHVLFCTQQGVGGSGGSDVSSLEVRLEEARAAIATLQACLGVGGPGEEAVRRHVHATLLPEVLARHTHDVQRIVG